MAVKLAVQTVFSALNHMTGPMASMSRGVSSFASSAQRASSAAGAGFRGLRSIIGGVVTALGTGLAVKALTGFAEKGDEIARMARTLGLSAENLQELNYAAKMADLPSEDLAAAFKKMNNSMGQLQASGGALYTYLKKTNPQLALQLKHTKDSDAAFTLIMTTIKNETDVQKRAALAQAAFGKSGQALIEMANGLADARREAHAQGAVISNDDVGAAERFESALKNVKAALAGIGNTVLGSIATSLGPVLEGMNRWILANKDFIGQNIAIVFKVIGDVFQQIGPSIVSVIQQLLPAIQQIIDKALPVLVDLLESLLPILPPLLDLLGPVLDLFMALAPAIKAVAELVRTLLVPVLQILKPILELVVQLIKPIMDAIAWVSKGIGGILGPALNKLAAIMGGGPQAAGVPGIGPVSPNTGIISSNVTTTRNSILDVNFGNTPAGTTMQQRGRAPGITVNMGPTLALAGGAH